MSPGQDTAEEARARRSIGFFRGGVEVNETVSVPRVGMFATVRNRRGIVAAVEPFDGEAGRLHLVHVEYKDDQLPTR